MSAFLELLYRNETAALDELKVELYAAALKFDVEFLRVSPRIFHLGR